MAAAIAVLIALIPLSACTAPSNYMQIDLASRPSSLEYAKVQSLARRAQAGDKQAQLDLAIRFEDGCGVVRDLSKARKLYAQAASDTPVRQTIFVPEGRVVKAETISTGEILEGLPAARMRLNAIESMTEKSDEKPLIAFMGIDLASGAVSADEQTVQELARQAKAESRSAQLQLGLFFQSGYLVPKNSKYAKRLFELGTKNSPIAILQKNLGNCYSDRWEELRKVGSSKLGYEDHLQIYKCGISREGIASSETDSQLETLNTFLSVNHSDPEIANLLVDKFAKDKASLITRYKAGAENRFIADLIAFLFFERDFYSKSDFRFGLDRNSNFWFKLCSRPASLKLQIGSEVLANDDGLLLSICAKRAHYKSPYLLKRNEVWGN